MPDPVGKLCQIIAQELRSSKNITNPELIDHVNKKISQDSELKEALISDQRIQQINRDNSVNFQTRLEGGTAYIGSHIQLPENFINVLENVFHKLLENKSSAKENHIHLHTNKDINNNKSSSRFASRRILLLSANPQKTESSHRRKEIEEIENALNRATVARLKEGKGDPVFEPLLDKPYVKASDLSQALSTIEPYIIYISGRETGISNLIFENRSENKEAEKSNKLLEELFQLLSTNTQCVILNGCYLEDQAMAIVRHIDFLIAISQDLEEKISISFLVEFYYHLGLGLPIKQAFQVSRNRFLRENIDEYQLPIILEKEKESERRELEKALVDCNKRIEQEPNKSASWIQRGNILKQLERFTEADEAYEKASLLDPKNYFPREKQGDALEKVGKYDQAIIAYDKALVLEEKNYEVWWKKGRTLAKSKNYREALESYKNALALKPLPPDHYIISREIGLTLSLLDQNRESIAYYKMTLRTEPRYRAASYEKKKIYKKIYSKKQ